jgi:thiosulfate/3-mercaptopyruvate sulfurtransferase
VIAVDREGRSLGAVRLHFRDFLNEDDTLKTHEEIRERLEQAGMRPDMAEVVAYCRLSHRATPVRFALTYVLAVHGGRVYDGSRMEWGSTVGLPIAKV